LILQRRRAATDVRLRASSHWSDQSLRHGAQDDCARLSALRRWHPRIIVGLSFPQMKLDRYAHRARFCGQFDVLSG
jgi:hypothetical protein